MGKSNFCHFLSKWRQEDLLLWREKMSGKTLFRRMAFPGRVVLLPCLAQGQERLCHGRATKESACWRWVGAG